MPVRKLKGSWWVDFQFNRQRVRKRSPVNTKQGALAHESRLKQKVLMGEPINEKNKQERQQSFKEFAEEWFITYVQTNNKPSEIRGKRIMLNKHLYPFFGKIPINQITTMQIEKFKAEKERAKLDKKTINNYLSCLSCCLKHARDWLELEKLPVIKRLKAPKTTMDFLTEKESETLLNNCVGIWQEMVYFVLKTGARFGELRALKWQDINWETGVLSIKRSIFRGIIGAPKSNQSRHIKLIPELHKMLNNRKRKSGFIFSNGKGEIIEENKVRRELWRAYERAGLRRVGWHMLRHSFASHLAMKGAPLIAIQELMGHSSITTTMRYAHLCKSTLNDSINLLSKSQNKIISRQPSVNQRSDFTLFNSIIDGYDNGLFTNIKQKQAHTDLSLNCGDGGS
ncbi:MAG: site-specific integrase [Patescibacteria group bacterium]|nr:site-specific integrase [Patescibacteria group bacterium]